MASVDNFLEEIADDITAAQKENSVLKSKMKVLVDKIEEYRANEEALNLAVISAQKLAVQIEADARTRAAAMIADADKQVKLAVGSIQEQTAAERSALRPQRPRPRSSSKPPAPSAIPSSRISTVSQAAFCRRRRRRSLPFLWMIPCAALRTAPREYRPIRQYR